MEIKYWILSVVSTALFIVLWWVIRNSISTFNKKMDEVIGHLNNISTTMQVQNEKIHQIEGQVTEIKDRQNRQSEKIRDLEIKTAKQ